MMGDQNFQRRDAETQRKGKCLFIGGGADGQWIKVADSQRFHRVYCEPVLQPWVLDRKADAEKQILGQEDYREILLRDAEGDMRVFIPMDGPYQVPIRKLVEHYRPGFEVEGNAGLSTYPVGPNVCVEVDWETYRRLSYEGQQGAKVRVIFPPAAGPQSKGAA